MERWDLEARPVRQGYPPEVVQRWCVHEAEWQEFRIQLKGKPTAVKLQFLEKWYDGTAYQGLAGNLYSKWQREVQVGNYLGALRRGGQLDSNNQVRRYL